MICGRRTRRARTGIHVHSAARAEELDTGPDGIHEDSVATRYRSGLRILDRLTEAESSSSFLDTRFIGKKRFSLEGGDSTIPAWTKFSRGRRHGVEEALLLAWRIGDG